MGFWTPSCNPLDNAEIVLYIEEDKIAARFERQTDSTNCIMVFAIMFANIKYSLVIG
jgi:hypothetical protein